MIDVGTLVALAIGLFFFFVRPSKICSNKKDEIND